MTSDQINARKSITRISLIFYDHLLESSALLHLRICICIGGSHYFSCTKTLSFHLVPHFHPRVEPPFAPFHRRSSAGIMSLPYCHLSPSHDCTIFTAVHDGHFSFFSPQRVDLSLFHLC